MILEDDSVPHLHVVGASSTPSASGGENAPSRTDDTEDARCARLFPNSLKISGVKHICDNLLHSILSGLTVWESLLPRLHSLDALLGNIDWRERFVAVCLASRPMEERNAVLNFAGDTLSGLRWEVISNFCKAVLPLEGLLRTGWNSRAYLRGVPAEGHRALVPEESTRANLTRLGQLMSSDTDWAYIEMICLLAEECELIGKWAEGCPCGLSFPDEREVQKVAQRALNLYDADPRSPGAQHVQSQRPLEAADLLHNMAVAGAFSADSAYFVNPEVDMPGQVLLVNCRLHSVSSDVSELAAFEAIQELSRQGFIDLDANSDYDKADKANKASAGPLEISDSDSAESPAPEWHASDSDDIPQDEASLGSQDDLVASIVYHCKAKGLA
ncbi:Uncharacterized protein SCF082_LOCUS14379 [Durusdinium trenchii]|uniref:Uncharacterized protein n=1 Tax=Durusdinium trenchii TaxID=1381693 RepID=A0ABP0JXT0_9DINO